MKTFKEIRSEVTLLISKGKWYIKFIGMGLFSIGVCFAVLAAIAVIYDWAGIETMEEVQEAIRENPEIAEDIAGLTMSTLASVFRDFITSIFSAIFLFSYALMSLKVLKTETHKWFSSALSGFRSPWGMWWLYFRQMFQTMLWTLLFIIPGIIAAYRYRLCWFLKAENPDWSAKECIAESGRLMKGHKWKLFCYDFYYFSLCAGMVIVAAIAWALVSAVLNERLEGEYSMLVSAFIVAGLYYASAIILIRWSVFKAIFYREIKSLKA
jgi:uncharacterized membrane protein